MRIAIIGRTEILYDTAVLLRRVGHTITCILTAKEAPEYARTSADFKALAEAWNVPFARGARIVEHIAFLKESMSDIAVSVNYPTIIPQEIIDLFPFGILNAHGGDLPRYRGNACQAWAILNGEERIGLCIHKMAGGELDSGDIIARDYFPLDLSTKITHVWNWMVKRTPELMLEAIEKLAVNPGYVLEQQSRNQADALRCYPRLPEDGRIDWSKSAIEVLRLINASNKPYAGAFCEFKGRRLTIWDAELVRDEEIFCAVPGQVTRITADGVEVACGTGKIRIKQVQLEGEDEVPLTKYINSVRERLR
ncbi:MAG: methionyl-tRNA formyltransferase [candidate division KSB1 bacterium]|nr:methionyl-tRNA formyltransferase [candidate division KSB1 bacterium]